MQRVRAVKLILMFDPESVDAHQVHRIRACYRVFLLQGPAWQNLLQLSESMSAHVMKRRRSSFCQAWPLTACATYQRVCPGGQDAWHHKEFASDIPQGAWPVQKKYVCQYSNFGGCCTAVACQMSMECCLLLEIVLHHENLLFLFESQAENPSALEIEHTSSAGHKI